MTITWVRSRCLLIVQLGSCVLGREDHSLDFPIGRIPPVRSLGCPVTQRTTRGYHVSIMTLPMDRNGHMQVGQLQLQISSVEFERHLGDLVVLRCLDATKRGGQY